jgi:hypothetical protein
MFFRPSFITFICQHLMAIQVGVFSGADDKQHSQPKGWHLWRFGAALQWSCIVCWGQLFVAMQILVSAAFREVESTM